MKKQNIFIALFISTVMTACTVSDKARTSSSPNNISQIQQRAERGNVDAQFELAAMYATGQGVEKNSQAAVKWYTKAAEQGDVASQYNLGVMYAKGLGVEQSYQNAMKWYLKAAGKGDVKAQYNLGVMNYMGQGVKQNTMAAYLWWKLASLKGLQAASNRLSQLKKEMTPEQLIKAKEIDSTMH